MSRLRIFLQTIRHAIFSHDSFMVFAIASLFYLVFYALPYDNQIIVKIPTAIVDMDQSRTSQDFTDKLRSAAVIDTVLETADFSQAREAFRRSEADVIVVIGENFSREILRGEQTVVTVFSNGAVPVKGRAVSAAVLALVTQENMVSAASRLVAQGLNPILVKQMAMAPSPFTSQDLYNNISGYGYYTVPMVAIVIVQAVMLFGTGIALGGWLSAAKPPEFFKAAMTSPAQFLYVALGFLAIALFWSFFIESFGLALLTMPTLINPPAVIVSVLLFTISLTALAIFLALWMNTNRYAAGAGFGAKRVSLRACVSDGKFCLLDPALCLGHPDNTRLSGHCFGKPGGRFYCRYCADALSKRCSSDCLLGIGVSDAQKENCRARRRSAFLMHSIID